MSKKFNKSNILISGGIFVILLVAGFLIYQTFLGYQDFIREKDLSSKDSHSTSSQGSKIELEEEGGGIEVFTEDKNSGAITIMKALDKKSVVMVVAFGDFRDEEYFITRNVFFVAGAEVKTASTEKGTALGADGGEAEVDLLIEEINPADFDAVVFIGGQGALKYLDNQTSYNLAKETISQGKILAAICISPVILAKAGVLEGKKATVWSSLMDKSPVKTLKDRGAVYEDSPVVADGKIVTGNGPSAADNFAMKIVELLIL